MSELERLPGQHAAGDGDEKIAVLEEQSDAETTTAPGHVDRLPPWAVLLHNDEVNSIDYVVSTILKLTVMDEHDAVLRMAEAHHRGVSMLLATHREHAELLQEQFTSCRLTVTIEPAP